MTFYRSCGWPRTKQMSDLIVTITDTKGSWNDGLKTVAEKEDLNYSFISSYITI
jgi:hypothetical protein